MRDALAKSLLRAAEDGAESAGFMVLSSTTVTDRNPSSVERATLLVVDDDEAMRRVIARISRGCEWGIIDASSSKQALELVGRTEQSIDLMLVDVMLPDCDGCELARRARALRPELRILFASGYGSEILAARGVTHGSFIGKPFVPALLRARIREELGRRAEPLT